MAAHVKRTLDSKPPHKQIRAESCNCSIGHDHSVYGSR